MRVAIHTLGCKVNQYESQAMEELLRARGHSLVPFEAQADVYLINSCTVTATSDKKSRQAVRQARKRAPGALVALCGCYPQVSPEAARQLEADLIGGSGDRRGFLDLLEQLARTREKAVALDDPFRRRVFEALPAGGLEGRTRAMLKVEDRLHQLLRLLHHPLCPGGGALPAGGAGGGPGPGPGRSGLPGAGAHGD